MTSPALSFGPDSFITDSEMGLSAEKVLRLSQSVTASVSARCQLHWLAAEGDSGLVKKRLTPIVVLSLFKTDASHVWEQISAF